MKKILTIIVPILLVLGSCSSDEVTSKPFDITEGVWVSQYKTIVAKDTTRFKKEAAQYSNMLKDYVFERTFKTGNFKLEVRNADVITHTFPYYEYRLTADSIYTNLGNGKKTIIGNIMITTETFDYKQLEAILEQAQVASGIVPIDMVAIVTTKEIRE